jgi:uncharacterized membrane protein YqhA
VTGRFGRLLWGSRLVMLVATVVSLVISIGTVYMATVDAVYLLIRLAGYADPALSAEARTGLRIDTVSDVVNAVDGYLLAAVLLIFALGLYELFVGKIEAAERSELASRLLLIRSLDDLKDRLAKVVLLILVVKFFQIALSLKYQTPLDLLYLALGILLVGGALYLSSPKGSKS